MPCNSGTSMPLDLSTQKGLEGQPDSDGIIKRASPSPPSTMAEIRELVLKDSHLPWWIHPDSSGSAKPPSQISCVLITGATGFLGSHLLARMLEGCPDLEKIYCLVRGERPEARLKSSLEKEGLSVGDMGRVSCVSGDVAKPKLGLEEELYAKLAGEVDAIFHMGARISYNERYHVAPPEGRPNVRWVNVGGLLQVLEFASAKRTKHVFNASSFTAVGEATGEDGSVSEEWPNPANLERDAYTSGAYVLSKLVGDLLLSQAVTRGIPCKSFRYTEIRGGSTSNLGHSLFMQSALFSLKTGILPAEPWPVNLLPVEVAARLTLQVCFEDSAPSQIYNVIHPSPTILQDYFPRIAHELGSSLELVPMTEYRKRVLQAIGVGSSSSRGGWLSGFQGFFEGEGMFTCFTGWLTEFGRKFAKNTEFFTSKRLTSLCPEEYGRIPSCAEILSGT